MDLHADVRNLMLHVSGIIHTSMYSVQMSNSILLIRVLCNVNITNYVHIHMYIRMYVHAIVHGCTYVVNAYVRTHLSSCLAC